MDMKKLAVSTALLTAALALSPSALADPDPHVPNGEAGWCPGGQRSDYGGIRYCLGAPFPNGAFYAQTGSFGPSGPFGPWAWHSGASCSVIVEGSVQGGIPYGGAPDCGGGPQHLS